MKRVDFLQPTGWKAEVSRCRRVNALEVLCPRVLYVISGQKEETSVHHGRWAAASSERRNDYHPVCWDRRGQLSRSQAEHILESCASHKCRFFGD